MEQDCDINVYHEVPSLSVDIFLVHSDNQSILEIKKESDLAKTKEISNDLFTLKYISHKDGELNL